MSAWASANRLVLGQLKVEEKSNEITAIPKLLTMLDIAGAIVTIDAMGCQKEIAKVITDQEADYVLALKDNHPTLHEEVRQFSTKPRLPHLPRSRMSTTKPWMAIMAVLKPVAIGSPRISRQGQSPPGPSCKVLGWWSRVGKSGSKCKSKRGIFLPLCRRRGAVLSSRTATGALRMRSIGFSMCPLMRMPAGYAKTKGHRLSRCSAILP